MTKEEYITAAANGNPDLHELLGACWDAALESLKDGETRQEACNQTAQYYASVMDRIAGSNPITEGTRATSGLRNMVAYMLFQDGYTRLEIAKALSRDRSSVYHMIYKVEGILSLPESDLDLWRIYTKFLEECF